MHGPASFHWERLVVAAASLAVAAAIVADATPYLRGPAPYPPEWRWDLRAEPGSGRYLPVALAGSLLVALAGLPSAALARGRRRPALVVAGAVAAGWAFQLALLGLEPGGAARTLIERALSRTSTSYLNVAESDAARDPAAFVDRHAELLPALEKAAKHAATHPLGPVLYYRAFIGVFQRAPAAAASVLAAAGIDPTGGRRPASVRAAALAGALLITLLGALAAWPVALLGRAGGLDPASAARIAAVWPLVPGAALMAPHFDQLLALPVTAAAALLGGAVLAAAPARHAALAVASGLCAGLALHVSYGAAALTAIACAAALAVLDRRPRLVSALAIAVATAAAVVALPMAWGHDPVLAARTALAIHRQTYTAPRSYATWLLFNPLDLALFAGVPVAVLFVARLWRARDRGPFDRMRVALAAGVAVLFLSGTVRGEVGRIAVPLMPSLLVAALGPPGGTPAGERPAPSETMLVAALLLVLTVAMALTWSVA